MSNHKEIYIETFKRKTNNKLNICVLNVNKKTKKYIPLSNKTVRRWKQNKKFEIFEQRKKKLIRGELRGTNKCRERSKKMHLNLKSNSI